MRWNVVVPPLPPPPEYAFVLNENQVLLVFDSSNFYFSYIVQKNNFKTFSDSRVTNSGLRDFMTKYREIPTWVRGNLSVHAYYKIEQNSFRLD